MSYSDGDARDECVSGVNSKTEALLGEVYETSDA